MGAAERLIEIPYAPRPLQWKVHNSLQRFNVIVCHRRWGKTVFAINELIKQVMTCRHKAPRVAYICPLHKQAKQVAWDYVKEYSLPIPGVSFNEAELRADYPNGGRLQLFGADNADALRGLYLDAVVMDEYAQMNPTAWSQVIRPALADRNGMALFIGTPMGHNQFYELYNKAQTLPGWHTEIYRASETGILADDELAAASREMSHDEYEQEFECSWSAAVRGAYYAREIEQARKEGRITSVPYQRELMVHTAWDLGVSTGNETAIWFYQMVGREIHLVDYYEASNEGLAHYIKVVREKPYTYGDHNAPHDIMARELTTGMSRLDTAANMGINFQALDQVSIADGINAAQMLFPRMWFDEEKCRHGIDCLINYRREYDDRRGVFKPRPLHDWSSNGADAFRYLAMAYQPPTTHKPHVKRVF